MEKQNNQYLYCLDFYFHKEVIESNSNSIEWVTQCQIANRTEPIVTMSMSKFSTKPKLSIKKHVIKRK